MLSFFGAALALLPATSTAASTPPDTVRAVGCTLGQAYAFDAKLRVSGAPRVVVPTGSFGSVPLDVSLEIDEIEATVMSEALDISTIEGTGRLELRQYSSAVTEGILANGVRATVAAAPLVMAFRSSLPLGPGPGQYLWEMKPAFVWPLVLRRADGHPIGGLDETVAYPKTNLNCTIGSQDPEIGRTYFGADCVPYGMFTMPCYPLPPTDLKATPSTTSATLTWNPRPTSTAKYAVRCGDGELQRTTESQLSVTGLKPATPYSCELFAENGTGGASEPLSVSFTTLAPQLHLVDVVGTTAIPTLVAGATPLTGRLEAAIATDGALVGGQLSLAPATASLKSLGRFPVTARLEFARVGGLSGSITGGGGLAQRVRIKLQDLRALGIPIAGQTSANCQSRSTSTVRLLPQGDPFTAGSLLMGNFAIGELLGCSALHGLVDTKTAGASNSIVLRVRS